MPGEAQPESVIREFLTQSYNVKTDYDYYKALIKICEDQRDRDPAKFKEDYKWSIKQNLKASWEIMKVKTLMKFKLKLNIHFNVNLTIILNQLRIILMQQHIEKRIMPTEKR